MDDLDAEMRDIDARLSRLHDSLETGRVELDYLASRIKELKARKEELGKIRV